MTTNTTHQTDQGQTYRGPFTIMTVLFFMWGFMTVFNDILIVALLAVSMLEGGKLAIWCIVGVGLFTSIGWPNVFSLAPAGAGGQGWVAML
jgi:fucose permease